METSRKTYFEKKITFLNVVLTLLIVLLHAKSPERWGLTLDMQYPLIYSTYIFCNISIPLFFFISGMLFYRNCTFTSLKRKLKTRIHSLLIPYLVWNTLFVAIFYALNNIPLFADKLNMSNVLNTPKEIIYSILNSSFTVLWFVKVLIIYNICSPLILLMLRKFKLAIILFLGSIIVALFADYGYESPIRWLPIYILGTIMGQYEQYTPKTEKIFSKIHIRRLVGIILSTILLILYILTIKNEASFISIFRFASPLIVWFLVDIIFGKYIAFGFKIKRWMGYTFFIYCTHQFILNIIQKLCVINLQPTAFVLNATFIITPAITVFICIGTAKFLSRYSFYKYLAGGR